MAVPSGSWLLLLVFGGSPLFGVGDGGRALVRRALPELLVDGPTRQAIEHDPAQKLGVRSLNLTNVFGHVLRKLNIELDGACLPHGRLTTWPEGRTRLA